MSSSARGNGEPLYLHRNHVWVRQGLHPDETLVLSPQDALLKIGEIVELAKLLCLVGVVQVSDEPVSGVAEDIPLDRADLLRRIDQPNMVLGALLRGPHPDVG